VKEIESVWICRSCVTNGHKPRKSVVDSIKLEIGDSRYQLFRDGKPFHAVRYSVDATKEPKEIDLILDHPSARRHPGIFSIDSDVLRLCFHMFAESRPSTFCSEVGSFVDMKTFQRQGVSCSAERVNRPTNIADRGLDHGSRATTGDIVVSRQDAKELRAAPDAPCPHSISVGSGGGRADDSTLSHLEKETRHEPFILYRGQSRDYHRFETLDGRVFLVEPGALRLPVTLPLGADAAVFVRIAGGRLTIPDPKTVADHFGRET
jgi:uncharacterized protein (TIGR03067 family)